MHRESARRIKRVQKTNDVIMTDTRAMQMQACKQSSDNADRFNKACGQTGEQIELGLKITK